MGRAIQLKWIKLGVIASIIAFLTACSEKADNTIETSNEKTKLVIAFGPSSYSQQFLESIKPIMERKGYEIDPKMFSHNIQINRSMQDGEIDASIFQSVAYIKDINRLTGSNMVKLADTASAPQSIRSSRHQSLDNIKDGMLITVPNDPVNAERAARILESLGWIKVKPGVDPVKFNVNDIEKGKYELTLKEVDPAQALRTLDEVDYAIVNGNYLVNMGLKITDSLLVENTPDEHVVIVSIQAKDKDTQWAKDLKAAYESDEFRDYVLSTSIYDGFILPKKWNKKE